MLEALRRARCYLYTGTQPASYTLGLIEAMMTGIPVVSIGPSWMRVFPYGSQMFEGHDVAERWADDPEDAKTALRALLNDSDLAKACGARSRERAIELFGKDKIAAQWREYLG
jgi:glycosyltransferase involved in cell wall biosynthesis